MKKIVVIILVFWCVVFYTIPYKSHAQTPFTQPLLYPLPTKTIYDLATDSQGIIYMGTDKGLFRFNGKNVTQIPAPQARQLDITHLKKDKKGRLWGMNFARQILYLENDTLHNFPIGNQDLNASALVAFEFSENQIWVISNTAVVSYDFDSFKRVFACHYSEHLTQIGFFANNIYISTLQKILIFDEKHNFIQKASPTGFEVSFQTQNGYFHAMQRREIKAPLKRTSLLWDKNTNFKELPDIDLPTNIFVYHQTLTPSNIMWLCTRQGGYRVDIKTGKTTLVFPNKNVTDIIQDYQGNYWISTLNDGLWFCPTLHNVSYTVPPSIPQIELTAISLFEKNIYFGTNEGYIYIAKKNNLFDWKMICKASHSEIRKIIFNPKNRTFVSGMGIFDIDGKEKHKTVLVKDAYFGKSNNDDILFISYPNGFYSILLNNIHTKKKYKYGLTYHNISSQAIKLPVYIYHYFQRSYCISQNPVEDNIWIGYDDGLVVIDSTGNTQALQNTQNNNIMAQHLAVDAQGNMWVGTFQNGLLVIKNKKIIKHFYAGNPFKNNQIQKLIYHNDLIWIGTNTEIGFINPQNFTFTNVLASSGFSDNLFYKDFYPDEDGIWVITQKNLIHLPYNTTIQNQNLWLLPLKKTDTHTFKAEVLHYKNPSKATIKYRLKGFEQEWRIITEPQATIQYPNLPAGDYTLEVFAQDETMGLKSDMQNQKIHIPLHLFENIWLYITVFLVINTCIFIVLYQYFDRKRKKQLIKEQLWISQLKALRSQMNPHFLYNILNTVQGLVYSNRQTEAGDVLGNFSDLMRNTLQMSEKPYISLKDEFTLLQLYVDLEKKRFENEIQCNIATTFHIENWEHLIPSMLVQPFVENAFKHGLLHKKGEKQLDIIFQKFEDHLQICVEDNGIGRTQAQEIQKRQAKKSTAFALNATNQRVNLLNQMHPNQIQIKIIDKYSSQQIPTGTKVLIKFYTNT